jgi:bifunctional polynucleotide phosphatase/kinase
MQAWCNGGVPVSHDAQNCLFVGDSAGRPKVYGASARVARKHSNLTSLTLQSGLRPADPSAADLAFALNIGVPFATSEAFFLRSQQTADRNPLGQGFIKWEPTKEIPPPTTSVRVDGSAAPLAAAATELIVLVAPAACGKSSFVANHLPAYARINQDLLKKREACVAAADASLRCSRSVVVDATNKDRTTRAVWLQLAAQHKVPARAIVMQCPKELSFHVRPTVALSVRMSHRPSSCSSTNYVPPPRWVGRTVPLTTDPFRT